jgi:DNA-binding CsgD family transcriptional regulator
MNFVKLVEKADSPAVATDASNRLIIWNEAAEELLALSERGAEEGVDVFELIEARDSFGNRLPSGEVAFLNMAHQGEPVNGFELTGVDASGDRIRLSVLPVVTLSDSREASQILYFLRPMYRRRRADEAIERILSDPVQAMSRLGGGKKESDIDLTKRQAEILIHLAEGLSNAEIARALNISVNTVRTHVQSLLDRLEAHSRVEAVAKAFREGLL